MTLPKPHPGLVICYSYLWHSGYRQGRQEGAKDRPCVIVLTQESDNNVIVVPITHTHPSDPFTAIEIPLPTKQRLGLDSERSWVILDEVNKFIWPGVDLRPISYNQPTKFEHGVLPPRFFDQMKEKFLLIARTKKMNETRREA